MQRFAHKITLLFTVALLSWGVANAQSTDFSEVTVKFFSNPQTYSLEQYCNAGLGYSGLENYKPGEATVTVGRDIFSYKLGDGSGEILRLTPKLVNVSVLTSNGDVRMPVYLLDDDMAIRAVQFKDGHYVVYMYVKNLSSGKYVKIAWFRLRN